MYIKRGIIDRIEGGMAIIRIEDNQELLWEIENLPVSAKEGGEIIIEAKDKELGNKAHQELARDILNEIFNHH